MRIRIFLCLYSTLLLGISTTLLKAQPLDPQLTTALQVALDSMQQQLGVNGLGAAIQFSNDSIWASGSGFSTAQPFDPIGSEHAFAIASTTKTITAAAILQLYDEGLLHLDDSLHRWLPNFLFINPNITIRQLLRHESGIHDVLANPNFQPQLLANPSRIWTLEEVIRSFAQAQDFDPGTRWGYSNTNYLLLGMIIEAVTGKSYRAVFEERFFSPLALESFALPSVDLLPEKVAHLWLDITGDNQLDDAHSFFSNWLSFFSSVGPAGGFFARPEDMARWMRSCMSGSLFSADTWEEARQTVATPLPGSTRYGLGLTERNYLGLSSYGHGGDVSYSSIVVYFPSKDISIAVHSNDASIVSWALSGTIEALLKAFLDNEPLVNSTHDKIIPPPIFKASPNPFTENLQLAFDPTIDPQRLSLRLTDVTGRNIPIPFTLSSSTLHQHSISVNGLSELPPGIYFLTPFYQQQPQTSIRILKIH